MENRKEIRIAIDGGDYFPFTTVNSGIKRIVDSFLRNIPSRDDYQIVINYYYFSEEQKIPAKIKDLPYILHIIHLPTRLFSSYFLPRQVMKDNNSIYIGFSGVIPHFLGYTESVKKIAFLYDLGFISYPSLYHNSERMIDKSTQTIILSDVLVVLSNYAKKEIIQGLEHVEKTKIMVKYPGLNHIQKNLSKKSPLKEPYFVYTGVIKPIKNIEKLFHLFNEFKKKDTLKTKLVCIGKKEEKYWKYLQHVPEYRIYKKDIIFFENMPDDELAQYYQHSKAILNFSYVEGLGFSVLEALSLGAPVIANDLPIYQEFTNKFTNLYIGKNDKEIITFMKKTLKHQNLKYVGILTWEEFSNSLINIAIDLFEEKGIDQIRYSQKILKIFSRLFRYQKSQ